MVVLLDAATKPMKSWASMNIDLSGDQRTVTSATDQAISDRVSEALIRSRTIERLAPLAVSVVFILSACFLIAFAPEGRDQALLITAIALAAIGLGLGGFSLARLQLPGGIAVILGREPAAGRSASKGKGRAGPPADKTS
jgi:hypothetical protein